jgi:hypothetical protein
MAATSAQILAALVAAVKTITPAQGYNTTLAPANVISRLDALSQGQQVSAAQYPRVFVISEGSEYQDLPSHRQVKAEQFSIFALFMNSVKNTTAVPLEDQVATFIQDFERMIDRNKQMGGSQFVEIRTCVTDVGSTDPEAICLFEIVVQYENNLA